MPHIVKSYDQSLKSLRKLLSKQSQIVDSQLNNAWKALQEQNSKLAQDVAKSDKEVNKLCQQIRDLSIELLALRQPLAYDLRLVVSAITISSNIERIGDVSKTFVKNFKAFDKSIYDSDLITEVEKTLRMAMQMHLDALECLKSKQAKDVYEVWKQDDEIDAQYHKLFQTIINKTAKAGQFDSAVKLLFILKGIERIGDHASNIAEEVFYIFKGNTIFESER